MEFQLKELLIQQHQQALIKLQAVADKDKTAVSTYNLQILLLFIGSRVIKAAAQERDGAL